VSSFAVSALYRLQLPAVTKYVVPFAQLHGRVVANERFHREGASVDKRALLGLFRIHANKHSKSVEIRNTRIKKSKNSSTPHQAQFD
jgi:hypothetical protein